MLNSPHWRTYDPTWQERQGRRAPLRFGLSGWVVRLLYILTVLMVRGNATETADNIAAHESLFRLGIVCELLSAALFIFVTLVLYRLLKGVDQGLAVLMVILGSLMPVPIFFFNAVNDAAALLFARSGDFLTVFDTPQLGAFAPASWAFG